MANHNIDELEKSGGLLGTILALIAGLIFGTLFKLNTSDNKGQTNSDNDSKK